MKFSQKLFYTILSLVVSILGVAYWIMTIGDGAPGLPDAMGKFDTVMKIYTPISTQQIGSMSIFGVVGLLSAVILIVVQKTTKIKLERVIRIILMLSTIDMIIVSVALLVWGVSIWNGASHTRYTWLNLGWLVSLSISVILVAAPSMYALSTNDFWNKKRLIL